MYMDLKPNQQKRISFNITTMTSLGLIGPPKIGGAATMIVFYVCASFDGTWNKKKDILGHFWSFFDLFALKSL